MDTSNLTPVNKANPLAYLKAILTTLGAIVTGLVALYGEQEVLVIASVVVTALLTYLIPNWPTASNAADKAGDGTYTA